MSNGTAGTNPTGNVLTNDTDPDSSANGETKTVSGVVAGTAGSAVGNVASSVNGTYGSITIAANGSYTYTVDNSNATVQALRTNGQTILDVFTYTMTDAAGATSTTQIAVTIQGANDAPTPLMIPTQPSKRGRFQRHSRYQPNRQRLDQRYRSRLFGNGETKTVSGVVAGTAASASGSVGSSVTGTYGSIQIAANGSYTYTVDNSNSSVQALRTTANTLQDVFTYTMIDAAGLSSTATVTITIQGANDAPSPSPKRSLPWRLGGRTMNRRFGSKRQRLSNDTDVDAGPMARLRQSAVW